MKKTRRLFSALLAAAVLMAGMSTVAFADAPPVAVEWHNAVVEDGTLTLSATAHSSVDDQPVLTAAELADFQPALVAYASIEEYIPEYDSNFYFRGDEVARVPLTSATGSISLSTPGTYEIVLAFWGDWEASEYGLEEAWFSDSYFLDESDWSVSTGWYDDDYAASLSGYLAELTTLLTNWESATGLRGVELTEYFWTTYFTDEDAFNSLFADFVPLALSLDAEYGEGAVYTLFDILWSSPDTGFAEEYSDLISLLCSAYMGEDAYTPYDPSPEEAVADCAIEMTYDVAEYLGDAAFDLSGQAFVDAVKGADESLPYTLADDLYYYQRYYGDDAGFLAAMKQVENGRFSLLIDFLIPILEGVTPPSFPDVPDDVWYSNYVIVAADNELITGKGDGSFAPFDNLTIGEALTLAARFDSNFNFYGGGVIGTATGPWYQAYVDYMQAQGLPWQYDDYAATIDRAEFAHIMNAVFSCNTVLSEDFANTNVIPDGSISDVPASHPYAGDIYNLYRAGVLSGSDPVTHVFLPNTAITRCEVAAILCRMLGVDRQLVTMP